MRCIFRRRDIIFILFQHTSERPFGVYDVIVIGGGPSGSIAAYLLAREGFHVAVVEKKNFPRPKLCGGGVTLKAGRLLDGIIDLNQLKGKNVTGSYLSFRDEHLTHVENANTSYSINRHEFDNALLRAARSAGCEIIMPAEVVSVAEGRDNVVVTSRDRAEYRATFLILAEGINGKLHEQLGYGNRRELTMALEIDVRPRLSPQGFDHNALFDFGSIEGGYGWVFPKDGFLNVGAYYRRSATIDRSQQKALDSFLNRFSWAADAERGPLKGYPVPYRIAYEAFNTSRTVLVGDAAGAVENFFGEGIFYGLSSGTLAAESVTGALRKHASLHRYSALLKKKVLLQIRASRLTAAFFYPRQRFGYYAMVRNRLMNSIYAGLIDGRFSHRESGVLTVLGFPLSFFAGNLPAADFREVGLLRTA